MSASPSNPFNWSVFARGLGAGVKAYNPDQPLSGMGAAMSETSGKSVEIQDERRKLDLEWEKSERERKRYEDDISIAVSKGEKSADGPTSAAIKNAAYSFHSLFGTGLPTSADRSPINPYEMVRGRPDPNIQLTPNLGGKVKKRPHDWSK